MSSLPPCVHRLSPVNGRVSVKRVPSFSFVDPEVPTGAEFLRALESYLKTDSGKSGLFIHFWRRHAEEHRLQNRHATFTHYRCLSLPPGSESWESYGYPICFVVDL